MQCRTCGYLLFNLTEPRCPECNTPYDLRSYSFEPGSVHFGCPHCDQLYEGNDAQGLPDPPWFECVTCGKPVDINNMRVVPVSDAAFRASMPASGLPWEQPGRKGVLRPWWETCKLGMFRPTRYYQQLRFTDDLRRAIGFAAMCAVFSGVLATLITIAITGVLVTTVGGFAARGIRLQLGFQVVQVVLAIPLQIAGLFVMAGVVHLGVMMLARQRRGYRSTVVVLAYAMCPAVWALIPFFGGYVFGMWSLVVGPRGIAVVHRTTLHRAAATYYVPVLIILVAVLFVFFLIVLAMLP